MMNDEITLEDVLKKLEEYESIVESIAQQLTKSATEIGFQISMFSLRLGSNMIERSISQYNRVVSEIRLKGYVSPKDLDELYSSRRLYKYGLYTALGGTLIGGLISLGLWIYGEIKKARVKRKVSDMIQNEIDRYNQNLKSKLDVMEKISKDQLNYNMQVCIASGKKRDIKEIDKFALSLNNLKKAIEALLKIEYIRDIYGELERFDSKESIENSLKALLENLNEIKIGYNLKTLKTWVSTLDELIGKFEYKQPFYDKSIPAGIIYILENEGELIPRKVSIPKLRSIKVKMTYDMLKDMLLLKSKEYLDNLKSQGYAFTFLERRINMAYTIYGGVILGFIVLLWMWIFR